MDSARSLLCIYHEAFSANWSNASDDCFTFHGGAHLCTAGELRRACDSAAVSFITSSWLADLVADDTHATVNNASCTNFDGTASRGTTLTGKYCCSEWMKY